MRSGICNDVTSTVLGLDSGSTPARFWVARPLDSIKARIAADLSAWLSCSVLDRSSLNLNHRWAFHGNNESLQQRIDSTWCNSSSPLKHMRWQGGAVPGSPDRPRANKRGRFSVLQKHRTPGKHPLPQPSGLHQLSGVDHDLAVSSWQTARGKAHRPRIRVLPGAGCRRLNHDPLPGLKTATPAASLLCAFELSQVGEPSLI